MSTQNPKFLSNEYIDRFSKYSNWDKSVKTISDLLCNENRNRKIASQFTSEEALFFDEISGSMKKSADMVTILRTNIVFLADAKLNSTTGSDITQHPEKSVQKYLKTIEKLRENPNYQDMNLVAFDKMVLIMPKNIATETFQRRVRQLGRKPTLEVLTVSSPEKS